MPIPMLPTGNWVGPPSRHKETPPLAVFGLKPARFGSAKSFVGQNRAGLGSTKTFAGVKLARLGAAKSFICQNVASFRVVNAFICQNVARLGVAKYFSGLDPAGFSIKEEEDSENFKVVSIQKQLSC